MDKDEYWLLDSALESWIPLRWLVSKNVGEVLNKRDHGLSRDELISVLSLLFQRGDLLVQHVEKSGESEPFIPTPTEIEEAFNGPRNCFYGLTPQGGARWEEFSQPHWERYIDAGLYAEPREGEIIGSDLKLVKQYDSRSEYLNDISVVSGSRHWDVLRPWQATYWKELPIGHRVRFNYEVIERPTVKIDPDLEKWFREIHNWYTPYTGS